MNRAQRLQAVANLLPVWPQEGSGLLWRYTSWFRVDRLCALIELELLGFEFPPAYREQASRPSRARPEPASHGVYGLDWDDHHAFIIDFTSGGAAYGVTWEEWEKLEASNSE